MEKELKLYQDSTVCYICRKKVTQKLDKDKIIIKLETISILQVNVEMQHIVYVI